MINQLYEIFVKTPSINPYTFRLFRRFEGLVWWIFKGKPVFWSDQGHLCYRPVGCAHGVEIGRLSIPDVIYYKVCDVQNRWPKTRRVLSY